MFDNEQNKTMIVHYIKVEFYLSIVKLCHYEEQSDEVIQYRVIPNLFRNLCKVFNLFNCYFHFLVPTRKRNKRNSRRRFRSHENSIIQQLSLTTRDFVYFLMFQNHSNSSTLCFINILGSLRYCRFLVM